MANGKDIKEIQEQIKYLNKKFQEMGGEIDEEIEESLKDYKRLLAEKSKKVWESTKDKSEKVDVFVKENPWRAVGIAFGSGIIIGTLMQMLRNKD